MAVIGTFVPTKEGGWIGNIRTLSIDARARFVPNDNRSGDASPSYRIFVGKSEVGAAWQRQSGATPPRDYLSVRLSDPTLVAPIAAALFTTEGSDEAHLVWDEKR
ncbi:MAG: DUF736 family protein [Micropepsaceae bacterium]